MTINIMWHTVLSIVTRSPSWTLSSPDSVSPSKSYSKTAYERERERERERDHYIILLPYTQTELHLINYSS